MNLTVITEIVLKPFDERVTFAWTRPKKHGQKSAWKDANGRYKIYTGALHLHQRLKIGDDQYKAWVKEMIKHKTDVFYWEGEGIFVTYASGYIVEIKNLHQLLKQAE